MVDRDALSSRLNALESYLAELKGFTAHSRDAFVGEPALHHLAERYLHLACECVLDVANHLIADLGLRQATSYKETMDVLREGDILDLDLAARLKEWMGFRNVLVHIYLGIDHGRSYDLLSRLGELEAFARAVSRFLEDEG